MAQRENHFHSFMRHWNLGLNITSVDEDVSTANFMSRDGRMRASKEKIISRPFTIFPLPLLDDHVDEEIPLIHNTS